MKIYCYVLFFLMCGSFKKLHTIKVAIIDTNICKEQIFNQRNIRSFVQFEIINNKLEKIEAQCVNFFSQPKYCNAAKKYDIKNEPEKKIIFFKSKNHATQLCNEILQYVSGIEIISIDIYRNNLKSNKEALLIALSELKNNEIDILLLPLSIIDFDSVQNKIDREIIKECEKFSIVVIPTGNHGPIEGAKPLYAYTFFSVTALQDKDSIADFATKHKKYVPHFACFGPEGTSFAAARMTIFLIKQLQKGLNFKQIIKMMKKFKRRSRMQQDRKIKYEKIDFEKS